MGSERHEFLFELLALCAKHGVTDASVAAVGTAATRLGDGAGFWISSIMVSGGGKAAVGYWDGERHEVNAP